MHPLNEVRSDLRYSVVVDDFVFDKMCSPPGTLMHIRQPCILEKYVVSSEVEERMTFHSWSLRRFKRDNDRFMRLLRMSGQVYARLRRGAPWCQQFGAKTLMPLALRGPALVAGPTPAERSLA